MNAAVHRHAPPPNAPAPLDLLGTRFFEAALVGDAVHTRGSVDCRFWHRLDRGPGQPDDGIFAEWRWDGETLTVTNDRYGMYPLFYCAGREAVRVSPSIATLVRAGAPAELDHEALAIFLRLGFFLGDDTPFARIKALPPNARLVWRRGELALDGGRVVTRPADLTREAAIDGYVELFRQSIRRRLPENEDFAVPLSGGRDSRHILLELCEQGRRPKLCVTTKPYRPRTDEDVRVASLVTAALALPHAILDQPDRFDAEHRKNVATSFCSDEHTWALVLAEFLRGRAATLFDGIGGDVLSAGLFLRRQRLALYEAGRFAELADLILPPLNERTLSLVLRPGVRAVATRSRAVHRIAVELERHAEAPNPIGSFYFWNRTRREINLVPYALLSSVGTVFAPYLDHDLYDFLAALPLALVRDGELHTDVIRHAYPKVRDVPFEDKAVPRVDVWMARRQFLRQLVEYAGTSAGAPPSLTRAARPLLACASAAHRFFDVRPYVDPELVLYLLQLEKLAAGGEDGA